ncbi:MAG: hypothetical protein GEV04_08545, partial [Actinophytocola sp.]|nr:hypothetical protein [Actinophytocola sp.]
MPDPGIPVPRAATPTLLLYVGSLALWGLATWLLLGAGVTPWLTVPMHAAVSFLMFTVLHEATHHAAGRLTWVNELFGRLAQPFVAGFASFPAFRHIHIEHHRNTNESRDVDPDAWTTHGPTWQLPLRWMTQDFYYAWFWAPRIRRRPRAEVVETVALAAATVGVVGWALVGGWFWQLAVIYLIPQRIGITVLAWWFDWLPHHGLTAHHPDNLTNGRDSRPPSPAPTRGVEPARRPSTASLHVLAATNAAPGGMPPGARGEQRRKRRN